MICTTSCTVDNLPPVVPPFYSLGSIHFPAIYRSTPAKRTAWPASNIRVEHSRSSTKGSCQLRWMLVERVVGQNHFSGWLADWLVDAHWQYQTTHPSVKHCYFSQFLWCLSGPQDVVIDVGNCHNMSERERIKTMRTEWFKRNSLLMYQKRWLVLWGP